MVPERGREKTDVGACMGWREVLAERLWSVRTAQLQGVFPGRGVGASVVVPCCAVFPE